MAFREKLAWLSLLGIVLTCGAYFALAAQLPVHDMAGTASHIALLGTALAAQALIVGIASAAVAIHARREANAPADERDRTIARRGAAIAYFVLLIGMILVGMVMPMRETGWAIIDAALFVIAVGEVVRYAAIILGYRRGSHG